MKLLNAGAWLAWLVYDVAEERYGPVPSRRALRWNTRTAEKRQADYWYHPGDRQNMPFYRHEEAWLFRLDVTPLVGEPFTLWEIDHDFTRGTRLYGTETPSRDGVRHMCRVDFYTSGQEALDVFRAIAQGPGGYVRQAQPGEPELPGGAWFHIRPELPHVLYADHWKEPLDVIELGGRDVHEVITQWMAGRAAAGLPRTVMEAEELAGREEQ